jgi:hypothetical protein
MGRILVIAVAVVAIGIGASLSLGTSVGFAKGSVSDVGAMPFPGTGNGELFCSPGWWKNHPEEWEDGICCIGLASDPTSQCGVLDEMLRARGRGSVDTRTDAQTILSACFASPPCDDD